MISGIDTETEQYLCELSLMGPLKLPGSSRLDRNSASLWLCCTKHRFVARISL